MNAKHLFVAILSALIVCIYHSNASAQQTKTNILFIAIDDLRPELGCYGATQVKSPNIDKLATVGLLFNRAYCNIPVCGASRASLLTGILPTKTRFVDYLSRADVDVPNATTLSQTFKEAGYTCISNGKVFHNSKDAMAQSWSKTPWMPKVSHSESFDPATKTQTTKFGNGRIYEAPEVPDSVYPDFMTAQKTIKDLQHFKNTGEPFFLACGFFRPHMPFYAPQKYWDMYNRDSIKIAQNRYRPENAPEALRGSGEFKTYNFGDFTPKTDEWHKMMRHGYFACVSYADKLAGDVLNKLEKLGLAENTVVIIWGDHGWHLGEHEFWGKHNTLHNALQIPLIIKVPGEMSGKQTDALVESVDIFPTLCDLAGLKIPETVMGKSFKSVLQNPNKAFKEAVYARFKVADAIVTKDYTYSFFENGEEMLYNRKIDPEENTNIVADPIHAGTLKKMKGFLKEKEELAKSYKK